MAGSTAVDVLLDVASVTVLNGPFLFFTVIFLTGFLRVKAKPLFTIIYLLVCVGVGVFLGRLTGQTWVNTLAHFVIMCVAGTLLLHGLSFSVLAPCIIAQTAFALISALSVSISQLIQHTLPAMPIFLYTILPNLVFALSQVSLCFILMYILKKYQKLNVKYTTTYLPLLLLPCLLTIFVTYFNWNLWQSSPPAQNELLSGEPMQVLRDFVILLFAFLAFVAVLVAFYRLLEAAGRDATRANLEQQMKAQQQYVAEAKQRNEQYRAFQHDINNHFLVLSGLVAQGKRAEAEVYLKKIKTSVSGAMQAITTGNIVLDVLLGEKIAYAQYEGINVTWNIHLAANMGIDDFDLCIIFANAIDNAVHGCMESSDTEKDIGIVAKVTNNFLFIQIKNICTPNKQVVWGTGLKNMKAAADKYSGSIDISVNKEHFVIDILLCLPANL